MTIDSLRKNEFDPYYERYISKVKTGMTLLNGLQLGESEIIHFFESIPEHKLNHRYEANKWNIKEVFQHLIDTERIFIYRCFRIARMDQTALAGYDQDQYIMPSGASEKKRETLIEEFLLTRKQSISIVNSLTQENLENIGYASGAPMSARAAAFVIIGHEIWHMDIIKERYLAH